MTRRALLLTLVVAAAILRGDGPALAANRVDQQNTPAPGTGGFGTSIYPNPQAQTFTAGAIGELDAVSVSLGGLTSNPNRAASVVVRIFPTDGAGSPDTSVSPLGAGKAALGTVAESGGWLRVPLSRRPTVRQGRVYALVVGTDGPLDFGWSGRTGDRYPRGTALPSGGDYSFQTFLVRRRRH